MIHAIVLLFFIMEKSDISTWSWMNTFVLEYEYNRKNLKQYVNTDKLYLDFFKPK